MTGHRRTSHVLRRAGHSPVALLGALLVAVLSGWATVTYVDLGAGGPSCTEKVPVRVAVAPAVAPAVEEIARAAGWQPCISVTVRAQPSIAATTSMTNPRTEQSPDAWLPESTFWLRRARSLGAFEMPERGTSVGSSPVVLAMNEPAARRLGWPAQPLDWAALVGSDARDATVAIPDPAVDPVGAAVLLGVRSLAVGEPDPAGATAAMMRRLAQHTFDTAVRRAPIEVNGGEIVGSTEQAVLRHNALAGDGKLIAAYPDAGVPGIDLPYVVLPGAHGAVRDAATNFLDVLLSASARATLSDYGFRTPRGLVEGGGADDGSAPPEFRPPVALPAEEVMTDVLNAWSGVQRSARILTVLDISGSMVARVPGTAETRLSATVRAAQEGVGLLLDSSEIGVWVFSTELNGDRDYREIIPVGPLREQRTELVARLGEVRVEPDGATGLYDTTLAAYQDARQHWTAGRINLVLIMTDGRNEDAEGISRDRLLAELAKLQDPRRPLPILFIGLGTDIDRNELQEVADATGGEVFLTSQPGGIRQIFFSALADLSCLPPDCRR